MINHWLDELDPRPSLLPSKVISILDGHLSNEK
jgi:hypothetical protein